MVGYSKEVLFNYRHQYWLWTPILGPICGGLVGTWLYDSFVFKGTESIVNKPNAAAKLHYEQDNVTGEGHVATTV
jgi:aquaglyceroporin related protein